MFPADTSQSRKVSTGRDSKSTGGLLSRNTPIENNKTGDKSRTKKDRALSFLLSSFLRLPRAKSHKRSSNLPRNPTEQTTTSCSAHQSVATATATLKSTDCAADSNSSANTPGNCGTSGSGPDHDSQAVHPVAMRTNSQSKMTSTSQHSRTPSEASCPKKTSVAAQRLSVGSQFDAAQCAPTCTVPYRSRAAVKLDAALLCLERVAEYLQQIISRQMVTLLPGLCTVLFEILEEIYHFAFCGQSRVSGIMQSELPAVNDSASSFKRQKSLCASLLALIRELDVLLIDFYGDQLRPKPPSHLGNDKAKRASLQNVRHTSALIIARHKTELERHIFELVGIAKQSTPTATVDSASASGTTDQPQTTMAHSGNVHTATSGLGVPPAANTSGLTDDELGEQINMLSRKIHNLASNFRRISNSDSVETQSANSSMHNSLFLSNSNMLATLNSDDVPNGAKLGSENNATALRDLENKHIVIEQIEVRTTERPDENAAQTHSENAAKPHADCSDTHVERQACVEPTTVTELQERIEYDTVVGEDGRTYRRKRIIRKHVSTTHECEIIYSKKEQKVTPAMFLEDDHSGEQQLAAAGKLQPGVATNKRCIDQYIQILGKYKEKPDAANSCDVTAEPEQQQQQQKLSSMLAKSRELQAVCASAATDASEFASFQSVWRKQEIEVVYSKARTGSSSSEQRTEQPTAIIDDTNILPEELAILELSDADHLLVFRADSEDGPYLRGGTVVALIVHACSVRTVGTQRFTVWPEEHAQFQRVFLATYRTLISSERLCEMLVRRYLHFAKADCALQQQQQTANSSSQTAVSSPAVAVAVSSKNYQETMDGTAKFLLAAINELGSDLVPSSDRENSLVNSLCNFTTQLMEQYNNIKLANAIHSRVFEILNGLHQTKITQPLVSLYTVPETCSTEQTVSTLLQFRSVDIAQQLTIIDAELFGRIETKELLIWAQDQNEELCPNFTCFSEQFNNLSYWTRSLILSQLLHDLNANANRDRERLIVKFIKIMKHLRKLNNFNAFIALAAALGSAPVRRLDWSRSIQEAIDEFSLVIDSSSSFKNYRHALQQALQQIAAFNCAGMSSSMHSNAGSEKASQGLSTGSATDGGNCQVTSLIPYIGVMLTDLTFIHQGNKSYLNQKEGDKRPLWQVSVNMWKRWQQFNSLDVFIRIKQMRYVGLARDEKILRCFNGFRDFMDEDQQWTLFETIKSKV